MKLDDLEKEIKNKKDKIKMLSKTNSDIITKLINVEANNTNKHLGDFLW